MAVHRRTTVHTRHVGQGTGPLSGRLALVGAAFLFGSTFVVVQRGTEDLTPAAFLTVRFTAGALALLPLAFTRRARSTSRGGLLAAGGLAGIALLAGYVLQTVGLQYTSTSNSAFLTGLFVVFTPLLAAGLLRRPPGMGVLAGVGLATTGLFLLTGARVALSAGDALTLGCALAFAVHIVVLGEVAGRFDPVRLNAVQLVVVALGAALALPLTGLGRLTAPALAAAAFSGVAVSGLGFSLQLYGQRHVGPTRSALLLSLEPVFAGVFGYAVGERLGRAGFLGAVLILAGVVIAQLAPAPAPKGGRSLDRAV
jgi:drug/metabolite transporter (DMT)-like permease